ncbi:MAG: preprotein translocase subunit SecE [Elusimicrobiaceae bacterium]|nr:preprotein translocase subunit SecE [Elusimicrobiaceae bacterium]
MMNKAIQFVKDSVAELKKSTWLSRQEVIQSTILVGIVVVLVSAYVGIIDFGLTRILGAVVGGH